jgi:serine protease Do
MKELPKIVAQTEVGKTVEVKVWRNEKELTKKIKLGRLETSEDFKAEKKEEADPNISEIKTLKISVRVLSAKDVKDRKLPKDASGLVITNIQQDSLINYLKVDNIIIEAQKKKIRSVKDFEKIINNVLQSSEKTMLIAIYNNQNQRRYIGVKLD